MNLEQNIEHLEKKIQKNATKIEDNAERIKANSYALGILKEFKDENKRLFIILIIVLCMWFTTIGYLVYILNDTGTEELTTTESYELTSDGNNNFVNGVNNGEIKN